MIEASIKQTEPTTVAYIQMRGAYQQMPLAMGQLYAWIGGHGMQPTGMPMGVYLDDPATVPESGARWEVWAPVAGGVDETAPNEGGIGVKHIPAMTVASTVYKGPYEGVASTYEALGEWLAGKGYVMAGPPMETYLNDPGDVSQEDALTEVVFPVQRG